MNELLLDKLDEFYSELSACDEIKEMQELKRQIYADEDLRLLLEKYRNSSNKYDLEFINLKEEIINNSLVKRYREIENKLYFTTLEINQKLNSLVTRKRCGNENN